MEYNPNLDSFLKLGYFLDYDGSNRRIDLSGIDKTRYENIPWEDVVKQGKALFMESIEKSFDLTEDHLVPISGGLDSRAILGALLKFRNAGDIYTYTFGSPGTYDFEIGNNIAKATGTKHTAYDLTNHRYTMDEQLDVSRRTDSQCLLFCHAPVAQVSAQFSSHRHWSGFMGGTLTGEHFPKEVSPSLDESKRYFIQKNAYARSVNLTHRDDEGMFALLDCPMADPGTLSYEEQLDFWNRQVKYIAPHVLMKGFRYATPFGYPPLVDFFLSQKRQFLQNKYLYKQILLDLFPQLFSLPTKTHFGLPLNVTDNRIAISRKLFRFKERSGKYLNRKNNPMINYIDFRKRVEKDPDFRALLRENIHDLHNRKIIDWIDVMSVWNDHIAKKADRIDALLVLASLEIHLKAGKKI